MRKGVLLLLLTLCLGAQEYAVVSNKILDDMNLMQIRAIFLKKLVHAKGLHIVPVNLPPNSATRKSFEAHVLKMKTAQLKSYWTSQHYLGKRPPLVMKSPQSALVFVKKVQGALSYVKLQDIDTSVKVLYRWKDKE